MTDESQEPDLLLGGALALLLLEQHNWMHRRVETVAFIDDRTLRRRVSVDFSLPEDDYLRLSSGDTIMPLAFLDKQVLVGLDVIDASGSSLPLLTKQQNAFLAWSVLASLADFALEEKGEGLTEELTARLWEIAAGDPDGANDALRSLEEAESGRAEARLSNEWMFMSLATDLASRFLMICPVEGDPDSRSVIKFSYVTSFDNEPGLAGWLERAASKMGWIPAEFILDAPAVGEGASYHFEFICPPELVVSNIEATVLLPDDIAGTEGSCSGQRGHIYLGSQPPSSSALVSVWLRPPRAGLLRAALGVTAGTFALLIFFLLGDRVARIEPSESIAVLLSVPAVISTFIVRPGEHRLATGLLSGVRAAVVVSGTAALVGAVLIVGEVQVATMLDWWRMLAIVSGFCFLSTLMAFIGFPPVGRVGASDLLVAEFGENGPHDGG